MTSGSMWKKQERTMDEEDEERFRRRRRSARWKIGRKGKKEVILKEAK